MTSFDASSTTIRQSVDITLEHRRRRAAAWSSASRWRASRPCRAARRGSTGLPLKPGQPLDRALIQASRETALDELQDHGYPYATVRLNEPPGTSDRQRVAHLQRGAGSAGPSRPIEIQGNIERQRQVVRRQLTFRPGDVPARASCRRASAASTPRAVRVRERRSRCAKKARSPRDPDPGDGDRRQARKVNFGVGYGSEEKARGRSRLAPRQLFRRRANSRRLRAVLVARPRRAPQLHAAVFLQPELLHSACRASTGTTMSRRSC